MHVKEDACNEQSHHRKGGRIVFRMVIPIDFPCTAMTWIRSAWELTIGSQPTQPAWLHTFQPSLVPRPTPFFCSSVSIDNNTRCGRAAKNGEGLVLLFTCFMSSGRGGGGGGGGGKFKNCH